MTDLQPFRHGEEGTHSVCNKHNIGGKSVCCECSGKKDCSDTPNMTKENKCCEKCRYIESVGKSERCVDCICHKNRCCKKCNEQLANNFSICMDNNCPCHSKEKQRNFLSPDTRNSPTLAEWEEEFKEIWFAPNGKGNLITQIRSFISSQIKQAEARGFQDGVTITKSAMAEENARIKTNAKAEVVEEITKNIGMLRQWINEKPADMLVTDEHIKIWLFEKDFISSLKKE